MVRSCCQTALALVAASTLVTGCGSSEGRPDDELGGLVIAPTSEERKVDVARVTERASELRVAATMQHRKVGELLGGHVFDGTSKIEVTENGEVVESVADTTHIAYREDGQYHASLMNSRDYGRTVYYLDGAMLLAPRYSKFNKRPPADEDEPARVRDEIFGSLGAQLELVLHAAELSDRGGSEVGGRAGRTVGLALAPGSQKPPKQDLPRRKWRESVTVKSLTGELVLDAENGAPLKGTLDAEVAYSRDGRSFVMTIAVTHALSAIGGNPELQAPPAEKIIVVSEHHQEALEREELLRGIAPPARKAPTPENTLAGPKGGPK